MRRITPAFVVVITLCATQVARANDLLALSGNAKDASASDILKDVTATSPIKDDITFTGPGKGDETATSPTNESESVVPFVRLQPRSKSLTGASVLRSLHIGLAASQIYDVYSTTTAIRRGAIEANPLMKNIVSSRAAFIALKVAMTAGPIYEAEKLWKKNHRFAAIALMAASNGIMMAVAAHNTRVINNAVTVR